MTHEGPKRWGWRPNICVLDTLTTSSWATGRGSIKLKSIDGRVDGDEDSLVHPTEPSAQS